MREGKVVEALTKCGTGDLDALVRHAYDDTPEFLWPLAARSLESHLIKLVREGRAVKTDSSWSTA